MKPTQANYRRQFLKYLASSPAIASLGGVAAFLEQGGLSAQDSNVYPQPWEGGSPLASQSPVITDPSQALDIFDFEEAAHRKMLPGHWAYLVSGVDSDVTLRANREAFNHVQLRPRRLRDMTKLDMKTTLFGTTYDSPMFTCPTGGQRNIWLPDGELSVSRARKTKNTMQMLAEGASQSVEDCCTALGRPVVFDVAVPLAPANQKVLLDRLTAAGVTTIVAFVDVAGGRDTETDLRVRPKDIGTCSVCHEGDHGSSGIMSKGFDNKLPRPPLDWNFMDQMRQAWKGKFGVKGILTSEDAALSVQHGLDFVYVSNHGGRATESFRSTIESLPEVVAAANGKVPVFIDGGFRRGTDVFKALALGATAVGLGRAMLWGLGAFGQPGVEKVLDIMHRELQIVMGNCGTRTIAEINKDFVLTPDWKSPKA
jgi:4-hydroxymandelate oxidase